MIMALLLRDFEEDLRVGDFVFVWDNSIILDSIGGTINIKISPENTKAIHHH